MKTRHGRPLLSFSFRGRLLQLGVLLLALVHRNHDFKSPGGSVAAVVVEAFSVAKSTSPSASFRFPKSSYLESPTQQRRKTRLFSTSASAAYLESISYRPPSVGDGLLGVTSKYLEVLSSVQNQMYTTDYTYTSETSMTVPDATTAMEATVPATITDVPFSEDQLVNEVVQRGTQEFSQALEAFAGDTYDSFVDSTSTLLADSMPAYIWDLDDTVDKGRKSNEIRDRIQKGIDNSKMSNGESSNNPEETLRELTNKLDNTFDSFRERLSSSRHSIKSSFAGSLRRETTQPNAAVTTARQQQSIVDMKQIIDEGGLNPNTLQSTNSAAVSKAATAITETQEGIQKSLGSLVSNTNQSIESVLSGITKTTTAATTSVFETTAAATSSAMDVIQTVSSHSANALSGGTSSAMDAIQTVSSQSANALSGGASSIQGSFGVAGAAFSNGASSAVGLSATQGFGLPGNTYTGGGDVAGMIEMVTATIVSIPRALMDTTMMETNPNRIDDLMEGVSTGLYNDVLVPLSAPLHSVASTNAGKLAAASVTPLDQAQAVLKTLQMVLGLVVGIPRAALEGVTGLTIDEIKVVVEQTDLQALSEQLTGFASVVSTVLLSLLKVIANAISIIVTKTGFGDAVVARQEELVSRIVSFVVEDLLPAIVDGLFLVLQQFAVLLLEGGSAILATL